MSIRTLAPLLIASFALLLTLACGNANSPEKSSTPPASTTSAASASTPPASNAAPTTPTASGMKVDLKVDPAEPAPNKPAKFAATVTDADGKPVTGANVNVSLEMKGMDMGKNEFKLADKGNGAYEGQGKFGMAGDWNAVVTAKHGDQTTKQTFPAKSVMPKK